MTPRARLRPGCLAVVGVLACGSPSNESAAPPSEQFHIEATIAAGTERTLCRCVVPTDPDGVGVAVESIAHAFTGVSHHLFVYEVGQDRYYGPDTFPCEGPDEPERGSLVYATQARSGELAHPSGVVRWLPPGAALLVEWHVVNATAAPISARAMVELGYSRADVGEHVERAGTLAFYHPVIHVAPRDTAVAKMRCTVPVPMSLWWAIPHMHRRGVFFSAHVADEEGSVLREILSTDDWDSPGMWRFPDGIDVHPGQVIEYGCRYENHDDRTVVEGPTAALHEMCMFVAGYHPRGNPLLESCSWYGSSPVFDGERSCWDSWACILAARDDAEREGCWSLTTGDASAALFDLAHRCATTRCRPACHDSTVDCAECVAARCADELEACGRHELPASERPGG